jgi:hypothetical protein
MHTFEPERGAKSVIANVIRIGQRCAPLELSEGKSRSTIPLSMTGRPA